MGFITPVIGPNKSKKLTRLISNFAAYIVCRRYKQAQQCEFLGFIWTDCWGNKSPYVITSPAGELYRTSADRTSTLGCKLIEHPSYNVDLWICKFDDACHGWTEMFLCHSIKISISLGRLNQSSPFFHHCKGKFMTNLEIDIICSRFFKFLKYSSHPMISFLWLTRYSPPNPPLNYPAHLCSITYMPIKRKTITKL